MNMLKTSDYLQVLGDGHRMVLVEKDCINHDNKYRLLVDDGVVTDPNHSPNLTLLVDNHCEVGFPLAVRSDLPRQQEFLGWLRRWHRDPDQATEGR